MEIGSSFIYGWLVEDNQTFAWLLQEKLKYLDVTNFAVNGYCILKSYFQYKEALLYKEPLKLVMIFYGSSIHDCRNVFQEAEKHFTRMDVSVGSRFPAGEQMAAEIFQ